MPIRYNDGGLVEPEKFLLTSEELVSRFGALTTQPQAVQGIWLHEDQRFEESNIRIFVDVEDVAENAAFFVAWKETLKQRFRQIDIWIVSYEIRIT
ncbi:MAG: hypothetical protein HY360_11165 [Verrucomicrobia bacterium]|nr:hypothetical protein [Verrucomicrobiota bacterium]